MATRTSFDIFSIRLLSKEKWNLYSIKINQETKTINYKRSYQIVGKIKCSVYLGRVLLLVYYILKYTSQYNEPFINKYLTFDFLCKHITETNNTDVCARMRWACMWYVHKQVHKGDANQKRHHHGFWARRKTLSLRKGQYCKCTKI